MPRVKQSKPTQIKSQETCGDAPVAAAPMEFAVGVAEVVADAAVPQVEKPKKARVAKVKPCVRCEERRARERDYAKISRQRARASKESPSVPATTTPEETTPAV
jgi:hypothetical protein